MTAIGPDVGKLRGAEATSHDAGKPAPARSALAGCRVLEISADAGAVAGRILADLGADVIKIEPPDGEPARQSGPTIALKDGSRASSYWLAMNLNKRSVSSILTPSAD